MATQWGSSDGTPFSDCLCSGSGCFLMLPNNYSTQVFLYLFFFFFLMYILCPNWDGHCLKTQNQVTLAGVWGVWDSSLQLRDRLPNTNTVFIFMKGPGRNRKYFLCLLSMNDPGDHIFVTHSCQETKQMSFRGCQGSPLQSAVILFHRIQPKSVSFYSQNILAQRHSSLFETASDT